MTTIIELIFCKCGCGNQLEKYDNRGRSRLYIKNHHIPSRKGKEGLKGSNNPLWKGGRILRNGYWKVHKLEHPYCDKQGYVREHRLVYEEYHKCCLLPNSVIHHLDKNRQNNSIENLHALISNSKHRSIHKIDMSERYCSNCNSTKTFFNKKTGWQLWYSNNKDGWLCNKCMCKIRDQTLEAKIKRRIRLNRLKT